MEWITYISGLLTTPVVIGLAACFGKVWADRILQKDRFRYQQCMEELLAGLRTKDTKELLVHQHQFQKEFEVYKELWMAALMLARAGSRFRMIQIGLPESRDEIREAITVSYNQLRDTVFDNRPFYASEVYETAKTMLSGLAEVVSTRNGVERLDKSNMSPEKAERATQMEMEIERRLDEINKLLDRLCDAIRGRIWSTTSSGWDRPAVTSP